MSLGCVVDPGPRDRRGTKAGIEGSGKEPSCGGRESPAEEKPGMQGQEKSKEKARDREKETVSDRKEPGGEGSQRMAGRRADKKKRKGGGERAELLKECKAALASLEMNE